MRGLSALDRKGGELPFTLHVPQISEYVTFPLQKVYFIFSAKNPTVLWGEPEDNVWLAISLATGVAGMRGHGG